MYYSILNNELLFIEVNNHPLFSYALTAIRNFTDNYCVYVDSRFSIDVVKQYHEDVKTLDIAKIDLKAKELPLHKPLLNSKHLSGQIDELYHYEINNELDCISIESLIKSNFCESRPLVLNKSYKLEFFKNKPKPKLLFTAPYEFFDDFLTQHIIKNYDVVFAYNAPVSVIKDLIKDREIIFTSTCPNYLLDNSILENSKIKVIATPSTGTNHIAESVLINNKFQIISIKESKVIEEIYASSEFSFALLLALVKKLSITCDNSKYGIWRENETQMRSNELYGKKIGLIGYGRIGRKMANFSKAFGMQVHAFDPNVKNFEDFVIVHNSKISLLKECDIVSLHYHLNHETRNSFTEKDFEVMKNDAFFVNTARGELVNEEAMVEALKNKKIQAAAIDVISDEHLQNKWNHPVVKYARENHNLLLSTHVAGLTVESETKAAKDIFKQLNVFLNGK
jgi:D-3-phosphoglycerate dehydrogenase / 2-oxoglutarate reductase